MDSQESTRQTLSKFFGWVVNLSRFKLPWGAFLTLENLQEIVPGEIRTRKGLAPSSDFTASSPTQYAIQSVASFSGRLGPTVVTVDANGVMRARRDGATFQIATGLGTSAPWRFCATRDGQLIAVNGLERGIIWRGAETAAVDLGVDPPTGAIADGDATLGSGGGLSAGDYLIAQRFVDDANQRTDPVYSELSAVLKKTATDSQKLTYDSSDLEDPPGRGTKRQIWRTTLGQSSMFYFVLEQDVTETSDPDDTLTDQQLIDAASEDPDKRLAIRGPYGLVARRFTPPPKTKGSVVAWKDRAFYAVDVAYDTGTVSTTSSDATLTGSGTAWTSDLVGRYVWIDGASKPYVIASVTNGTSLEFTEAATQSLSDKTYRILPDPAERNQVYYSALDEFESVNPTFVFKVQSATEDDDELTALLPFGSTLFCLQNRHAYAFTFSKEPGYDGRASYAFGRGCLNQECWDIFGLSAYVMDASGIYAFGPGGAPEPLSDAIAKLWREDDGDGQPRIDLSASKWFFLHVDHATGILRAFVKFVGDSGTRPTRALCMKLGTGAWWLENFVHNLGGACRVEVDGEIKSIVGANSDRCYELDRGELDGVSAEKSGTATGATSSTLTDSGATFGSSSELVGASVAITDGTGVGQQRRIASHTNTALTVSPNWTTTPDTTSEYVVGGIAYKAKLGYQPILDQARKEQENTSLHLTVEPISDDRPMRVREYWDFDASAETYRGADNAPDRLVSWEAGSTDKKVAIHLAARTNDAGTGVNRGRFSIFDYAKATGSRLQGKSHVAIEIEGGKGDEAIVIHRLAQSGTGN